jgi:hypothetical protein
VQDPSLPAPFVPASVFPGVLQSATYWSASSGAENPTDAWVVGFSGGLAGFFVKASSSGGRAWCVRGPMQESCIEHSVILTHLIIWGVQGAYAPCFALFEQDDFAWRATHICPCTRPRWT